MKSPDLAFYVQLEVKPQYVGEWKELLAELIENMSRETAYVSCTLHQSLEKENLFTLYERWSEPTVEAFVSNQMAKDYRQEYEGKLVEWLETPRTASIVQCLETWSK